MTKGIILLSTLFTLAACSTTSRYSPGDQTPQGVRIGLGAKDGIKVGDRIRAFTRDCSISKDSRSSRGCRTETVGKLTVIEVQGDSSSTAKANDSLSLNESVYFEKDQSCDAHPLTKQDPSC